MRYFILLIWIISWGSASAGIKTDRWMEIDLYWFDLHNKEKSVEQFWKRYHPLVADVDGWKGVIINVGWIMDYLLEWNGDLSSEIPLPDSMKTYPWFESEGNIGGTTQERLRIYKQRFEKAAAPQTVAYEKWRYKDLKELITLLKKCGEVKYKIPDLKIGSFVLGWKSIYEGETSSFGQKHPNIFWFNYPFMEATLSADPGKYASFPSGIPEGTPFFSFFARQWGELSRSMGLDAIVLRDSFLGVGMYGRWGPYGKIAPENPDKVASWHRATAELVKQTKQANPDALVIGYSNAASAIADWRVNCFDLETTAREGYLDAWIDQTWAGAWNEVGHRPPTEFTFWNVQPLGWTYQLAYTLMHAAILADTNVHHYVLTETYDAWESWDVIHNAPDRLKWGIWAYAHAAVKTPQGLKMPDGNYISWCNKGKSLLSAEDVEFLRKNINEAVLDAQNTTEVYGATLVYCRSAMKWQSENSPATSIKEWIDEYAGSIMKWSIPIMSATRMEYFDQVQSDMFIFQTPSHLDAAEKKALLKHLASGNPSMIIGSPGGGVDADILELIGVTSADSKPVQIEYIANINGKTEGIYRNLPNTFPLYQPFTRNKADKVVEVIYEIKHSPCLTYTGIGGKNILFWDAPEFSENIKEVGGYGESLDIILGSPTPFVLVARQMNEMLKQSGKYSVIQIDQYNPVAISIWKGLNNKVMILTGNLEEGINHTENHSRHLDIDIKPLAVNGTVIAKEVWSGNNFCVPDTKLSIHLDQAQTKLFKLD